MAHIETVTSQDYFKVVVSYITLPNTFKHLFMLFLCLFKRTVWASWRTAPFCLHCPLSLRRSWQNRPLKSMSTISVNHIGASAVLQEINRASHNCSSILDQYQFDRSSRSGPTLRTSKDPKSFKYKSARLWNRTPTSFKSEEVTGRTA